MTTGIRDRRVVGKQGWTDFNSSDELKRSDLAHEFAKAHIYPGLFTPKSRSGQDRQGTLVYDNGIQDGGTALDMDRDFGIDTIVRWHQPSWPDGMGAPICTIQERARSTDHARYNDLTMTVKNPTGKSGDLMKCMADFFLYGFFDIEANSFHRVWLISKPRLFLHILGPSETVNVKQNNKDQSFLTVDLAELEAHEVVIWQSDFTPLNASSEAFLDTLPPVDSPINWGRAKARP